MEHSASKQSNPCGIQSRSELFAYNPQLYASLILFNRIGDCKYKKFKFFFSHRFPHDKVSVTTKKYSPILGQYVFRIFYCHEF